ncbi:hypothetical protein [Pigmentiphaga sp. CHJ604]|uniref:hypothetical protein n=1 Tax=Pigmentiphaga sp. CHJ604 TaxID=3081984 RepID=UPI0030D20225
MSYLRSTEYSLYLGGKTALLRKAANWPWSKKWVALTECDAGRLDNLAEFLIGRSARLTIWLGGAHCRWMTFPLPPGVYTDDPLVAIARKLFADRLGLDATKWRVIVAPQRFGVVAAAAPISLIDTLRDNLSSKVKLRAVSPWFGQVFTRQNVVLKENGALGVLEDDVITLMDVRSGAPRISTLIVGQEDARSFVQRVALQSAAPTQVAIMHTQKAKGSLAVDRLQGNFLDCLVLGSVT